jgi:shikimate dehydrogenase
VNLTVPLKEVAFRALSVLDATAARLGAVNTLVRERDGWRGFNTDGDGFFDALREAFDGTPTGKQVFVFGAGGAGRAVAIACAVGGADRIVLADLAAERAQGVAGEIRRCAPGVAVDCVAASGAAATTAAAAADLVIQASPVGMKPADAPILDAAAFRDGQWFFDLVYMFPETASMRAAAAGGARAVNGLGMLLHQGARALRLWTGTAPPVSVMRRALEQAVYGHCVV